MALIAHYPLNGDTKDYSGYGRHGVNYGALVNEGGKIGKCYKLDGLGYISLPVSFSASDVGTISMWYNAESAYNYNTLWDTSIHADQWGCWIYANGLIAARTVGAMNSFRFPIGSWRHLTFTWNRTGSQKLYLDGELKSETAMTGWVNSGNEVNIGGKLNTRGKGLVNDIRIYDHALSDKEVKEIAKAKVLHYKFDEQDLTTKTVKDSSGFGNDGAVAVATAPSWSEDSPVGRGSMEFSGAKFITLPNMLGSDEQITVCAWFKANGSGGSGYHIIMGGKEVELDVTSAGQVRFGLIVNNVRRFHNYSSGLADGKYHHICGVYDGTVKDVYVDGVLVGSFPVVGKIKNNFIRRVGVFGTGTNYHANGNISDVRIYATALTPEDILELYQTRASVDNEGNLFVQEIDEISDTSKEVDSRGIARFKEFNEVDGENKMSIKNDGVVYVNEIMEA